MPGNEVHVNFLFKLSLFEERHVCVLCWATKLGANVRTSDFYANQRKVATAIQ